MHPMHWIFVIGHYIGFFHEPAVWTIGIMFAAGCLLVLVFLKVFQQDLFGEEKYD